MLNHFNFKRIAPDEFLITNDFGCYLFLSGDEFRQLIRNEITADTPLYDKLHSALFMIEPVDLYSHETADDLRSMKSYVFSATSLHIFVLTTACNLRCVYCQAQDQKNQEKCMMDIETARKAVDTALQSPEQDMTFEFQGGEPLLNFAVLKEIVSYTEEHRGSKRIGFTLVSNLALLTDEILDFLMEHQVSICTSIDGPRSVHDLNRHTITGAGSYELMRKGINTLQAHGCQFNGIQTTTRYSLPFAREIVHEYFNSGLPGIFLRPLTPLGFAKTRWGEIGYDAEEWLSFYRTSLDEILLINRAGHRFPEQHAVYFLKKILHGHALNYMELRSPCGAAVGQMAYYCNGDVYTCDEARMIAETGDQMFRLGNVFDNTYQEMAETNVCKVACAASVIESIPNCCDCVYQPYCGVCPVVNYALDGDIFPREPNGYRCQIYKGILDHIFSLIHSGDEHTLQIFRSWVEEDSNETVKEEC